MKNSRKDMLSQRLIPLGLVVLLGITFSVAAFVMVREKELETIRGDFGLAAKNLTTDLRRRLENNLDTLPLIRALFHGSEFVTREEFAEFVKPILSRNSHIVSLGWIQSVSHSQWPEFLRAMEGEGFVAKKNLGQKQSDFPDHFPICYLEGRSFSHLMPGADLALQPEILAALKNAAAQGKETSVPFPGADEANGGSYLFFLPVFGKNLFSGSSPGSEDTLGGIIFGLFPMQGVVKEIVSRYEGSGVSAVLYDGERFQREADAKAIDNGKRRKLFNVETFSLADRELVVVAQTLPGFIGRRMSWHPEATLVVGLLMTTLLLTYLVTTFRRSSQVELLAEKLSAEVAERKRVAEARERLVLELEAKNAELERFTYTVSHDLKSPLITIRGFTGLLAKDAEKGDMVRVSGDVDQIKRATDKMQQLLEELLELSRIGRLVNPSKNISLADLAREAVEMLSGRISKGKVEVTIQPGLPTVFGDRPRLLEVFQNLIDNAVKFMGDQPAPHIEIGVENRGKEVLCFVRDNGIGIHPRYQSKVFGLFERLDQNLEGTGIGLALVQRIINYHGGRIWIESEGEGKGSTFIFSLPSETKEDKADEN